MRIIETKAYKFNELTPEAQEKALDNCPNINVNYEWWQSVYEMVEQAASILGIEISNRNGGNSKEIYFSGFSHQGQGSCFSGYYNYAKGCVGKIKKEFPSDTTLHCIAKDLTAVQKREGYRLEASIKGNDRYYTLDVEVSKDGDTWADLKDGSEDGINQALNDFNSWIFKCLESEYDYLTSDEAVKESILANEYEFTKEGVSL